MKFSEIKEQKTELLQIIQNNMNDWDGTAEDASRIFETNGSAFEKLQKLDEKLLPEEATKINEELKVPLQEIVQKQKELMAAIENEKNHIQDQLGQLGNKNKVVSNYMALQKKSLFVEKNY